MEATCAGHVMPWQFTERVLFDYETEDFALSCKGNFLKNKCSKVCWLPFIRLTSFMAY